MNQILSLIRAMVKSTDQAHCLVMALVQFFPARALLQLGKELIELAEKAIGEEQEPEPESVVVVPVPDAVAVEEVTPPVEQPAVEQPAALPGELPAAAPAPVPVVSSKAGRKRR